MIHKSIPQGTYWVNLYLKPLCFTDLKADLTYSQCRQEQLERGLPVFQWQIMFITRALTGL